MGARPSISRTEVLLADEPISALDEQTEREILDPLRDTHTTTAVPILMVTHRCQFVPSGGRVVEMAGGTIVEARRADLASP